MHAGEVSRSGQDEGFQKGKEHRLQNRAKRRERVKSGRF